ncbi:hypothetical protein EB118_16315 [bacterium]|nr:hypothetical protein [bacterium]NDC95681.1 hypothetical protein [bacterium]NDD85411.1 hypothetical protein [bacterium]NDG31618.1 hypothetical protein [bacterium]
MKNFLEEMLNKRFQTTMIGSLFQFEESFGYLWGFDKDEKDLTETEKRFRLKWEDTRYNILNNGNNQLRSAIKDLQQTKQEPKKYNYRFYNQRED